MLILLPDECKPSDHNKIVCAEIPDTTLDSILHPRVHRSVKRCIIYGPCGIPKKAAVCMRGGSCSKQFPKKFTDATFSTKDGHPLYRLETIH